MQFLSKIWLIPFRLSSGDGSGGSSEGSDGGISENLVFSWLFFRNFCRVIVLYVVFVRNSLEFIF